MSYNNDSALQMVSNVHDATSPQEATGFGLCAVAFALLEVADSIRQASNKD